ncbi:hypothetical protein LTR36_005284 [Oleoguttula mirabilis]|uniref:EthD domain-containing protein n=1 Tax=Oleoguttula mirabilis TaxID=1507867 RepID=A0AAV9JEB6_9PEZI|nr:hypothetical protein LTR36_005284 [Oleoguttula mirabilis]
MPTPGLMFVGSRVLDQSKTSDAKYNEFYNNEHLPDVLKRGVSKVALRYKNANTSSPMPYVALYPLDDASYLQSPDLAKSVEETRSSKTFDNTDIYEHIHFDLRGYEKIQTFEGYGHADKSGKERGQTIVCVAMEPAEGQDQDFEDWYRRQHLDMLAMCRGYRRTTRYKKLDGQKPRYLALHEYACKADELPADQVKQVVATEWSQKIVGESLVFDRDVLELVQAQGDISLNL